MQAAIDPVHVEGRDFHGRLETSEIAAASARRDTNHLITRRIGGLYRVMSYSRCKDEPFSPASGMRC
jgi:hypothetical protein